MKSLIVGLDAATWRIMDPMLERGDLPNIQKLMEGGASGILRSSIPPMTPLAWTSIATGVNPGKHGIYDFVAQDPNTYKVSPINLSYLDQPAIWNIFNTHDRKVGVVNFPLVFPPPVVNSFFISGLASPERENYAYPAELCAYLRSKRYRIHPRFGPKAGVNRYMNEVKEITQTQCEVTIELMRQYDCELYWIVFQGIDWIQHYFWNESYEKENAVEAFYRHIDGVVGRLLCQIDDNWNIMILSDHGFREIKAECHMNNILEEWGYLKRQKISDRLPKRIKKFLLRAGWKSRNKLPFIVKQCVKRLMPEGVRSDLPNLHDEQLQRIDWSRTRAFSFGYMGRVYIHLKDKYLQGVVSPGAEYDKLREEIIGRLISLKDPHTQKPIISDIYRKEEVFSGDKLESAPDIVFNPTDFAYMIYGDFGDCWLHNPDCRHADHDMDGVIVMRGENIRPGTSITADVTDITPTLLYLHDLPLLEDMDGHIIRQALDREFMTRRKVKTVKATSDYNRTRYNLGVEEQHEVKRRLEDLGYM